MTDQLIILIDLSCLPERDQHISFHDLKFSVQCNTRPTISNYILCNVACCPFFPKLGLDPPASLLRDVTLRSEEWDPLLTMGGLELSVSSLLAIEGSQVSVIV